MLSLWRSRADTWVRNHLRGTNSGSQRVRANDCKIVVKPFPSNLSGNDPSIYRENRDDVYELLVASG